MKNRITERSQNQFQFRQVFDYVAFRSNESSWEISVMPKDVTTM